MAQERVIDCATGAETLVDVPDTAPVAPQVVTMRQAQLALHGAGLWPQIKDRAAADDEFAIWLNTSQRVERDNGFLLAAASDFNLTSEQVDGLFMAAAALP